MTLQLSSSSSQFSKHRIPVSFCCGPRLVSCIWHWRVRTCKGFLKCLWKSSSHSSLGVFKKLDAFNYKKKSWSYFRIFAFSIVHQIKWISKNSSQKFYFLTSDNSCACTSVQWSLRLPIECSCCTEVEFIAFSLNLKILRYYGTQPLDLDHDAPSWPWAIARCKALALPKLEDKFRRGSIERVQLFIIKTLINFYGLKKTSTWINTVK